LQNTLKLRALPRGIEDRERGRRVVVSKPIAKNTTSRDGGRARSSARRRTSTPCGCRAGRLGLQQRQALRGRHAHRVGVGAQDDAAVAGEFDRVVDAADGSTQTGQPGPCTISDVAGSRSARP